MIIIECVSSSAAFWKIYLKSNNCYRFMLKHLIYMFYHNSKNIVWLNIFWCYLCKPKIESFPKVSVNFLWNNCPTNILSGNRIWCKKNYNKTFALGQWSGSGVSR